MTEAEWNVSDRPYEMLSYLTAARAEWATATDEARRRVPGERKLELFAEACRVLCGCGQGGQATALEWAFSIDLPGCPCTRAARANILRDIVGNPFRPLAFNPVWRTPTVVALARAAYEIRTERRCERCGGKGMCHKGGSLYVRCDCKNGRIDDGALDPHRLAVLSDALEEAGCTDADVLNHLRGGACDFCGGGGKAFAVDGVNPIVNPREAPCMVCNGTGRATSHFRGCHVVDACLSLD